MRKLICLLIVLAFLLPLGAQQPPVPPFPSAAITFSGSGNNTIVAGVSGKGICAYGLYFTVASATTITVQDGSSTALTGAMSFTANGAGFWPLRDNAKNPWFVTSAGNALVLNSSNAVQVSGAVIYAPCII